MTTVKQYEDRVAANTPKTSRNWFVAGPMRSTTSRGSGTSNTCKTCWTTLTRAIRCPVRDV